MAPRRALSTMALAALLLGLVGAAVAGTAAGERTQRGTLISSLDGGLAPLRLPRHRPAPVAVKLAGGLQTSDGSLLPRVRRIEVGLPSQGVLSTRGLPRCPQRLLRNATRRAALARCRAALVGTGEMRADVVVPNQDPFSIRARLLAFNGRLHGRRAVFLHAFAADPPTVVVLPFVIEHRSGRFGTALVADLPPALGPWPHFTHFDMTLRRRFFYRGQMSSYLSASCPIAPSATAGFFSFARVSYELVGGGRISTTITRGCRAR